MKNKIIGILVCMLMVAAVVVPATGNTNKISSSNDNTTMEYAPGEFIVKLRKDITFSRDTLKALNEKQKVYAFEKIFLNAEGTILDNIYLLHVPIASDILSIVQEYSKCPDVVYTEPNAIGHLCSIPNDENFSYQWYLHNIGQEFIPGYNITGTPDADIDAPEAWDLETGSKDVTIATLDTGIDYLHPELATKIWNNTDEIPGNAIDDDANGYIDDIIGWDFYYDDNDPRDEYGHGTVCAGIAAASTNNGIGMAGVNWNCKIMPLKIFSDTGSTTATVVAEGLKYAADAGVNIISMSFNIGNSSIMKEAIDYAYNTGVFLCCSAGNSNSEMKTYPASYENVVAVAATNIHDGRCTPSDWWPGGGSQYGDWVDIAAPGHAIYSTMPTYHVLMNDQGWRQYYEYGQGTSLSSPMVAGVAALLLSKDPSLTPNQVKALLCGNVDPYNSTEYIGTGRLNAQKALTALLESLKVTIKGGIGVKVEITNNGTSDTNDVPWQINVKGGILGIINKTVNGTIDIPAGDTVTVKTGLLLGFGSISIIAKVANEEQTAEGIQIIIFSMVT